jgi:hypothetical protein
MNENMNADDFEQRLERQPMREVPAEWRSQILSAARTAAGSTRRHRGSAFSRFGGWRAQVVSLLWPSPRIWAGLAAVWVLLAAANRLTFNPTELAAAPAARPAAATLAAWKEQKRILAELMQSGGPSTAEVASPAKPRPRSELTGLPRMS